MIKSKNKFIIILSILLFLAISVFSCSIIINRVNANGFTESELVNKFGLEDGASVRFSDNGNGLRFCYQIQDDAYQGLIEKYGSNVKFGVLIAPVEGYDLSVENVFGDSAIYNWAIKTSNGWEYHEEQNKTRIINLEGNYFEDKVVNIDQENVNIKYFYGSIINILDANIAREFQAYAYVGYSNDGIDYTYVFSSDNVERSMAYVAQCAILDNTADCPSPEQKEILQQTYVNKVVSVETTYTVNYYFEQPDGTFLLDSLKQDVIIANINDNVSASKNFDNYVFDEQNPLNKVEGVVFANGKLELNKYFKLKTITVTYDLGSVKNDPNVSISSASQVCTYSKALDLVTPSCFGYRFVGWKTSNNELISKNAICNFSEDITLFAIWEKDNSSNRWGPWSPIV